jgi:hypothetical protein
MLNRREEKYRGDVDIVTRVMDIREFIYIYKIMIEILERRGLLQFMLNQREGKYCGEVDSHTSNRYLRIRLHLQNNDKKGE